MSGNGNYPKDGSPEIPEVLVNDLMYFTLSPGASIRTARPQSLYLNRSTERLVLAERPRTAALSAERNTIEDFENDPARDASWFPEGYVAPAARESFEDDRADSQVFYDEDDDDDDDDVENDWRSYASSNDTVLQLATAFTDFDSTTPAGAAEDGRVMRVPLVAGAKPWVKDSHSFPDPPPRDAYIELPQITALSSKLHALMLTTSHPGACQPVEATAALSVRAQHLIDGSVALGVRPPRHISDPNNPVSHFASLVSCTPPSTTTDALQTAPSASTFSFAPSEQESALIRGAWRTRMEKRGAVDSKAVAQRRAFGASRPASSKGEKGVWDGDVSVKGSAGTAEVPALTLGPNGPPSGGPVGALLRRNATKRPGSRSESPPKRRKASSVKGE